MKRAALLLFLTVLASGQTDEERPYFSISSYRTFGTGEKPSVEVAAMNVSDLDFRVYRVNDPIKFFREIPDPHQFGGQAAPPERNPTLLERFHSLKARWHSQMRFVIRDQFDADAWARVRTWRIRENSNDRDTNVTKFADVPVLNRQQLVATWRQHIKAQGRWRNQAIPVDVKDKGVYLVEAVRGELRAYTILFVSDLALITKGTRGRMVAFTVDRKSGAPVPGVSLSLPGLSTATDASGMADIALKRASTAPVTEPLIVARNGSDIAAAGVNNYWTGNASGGTFVGYTYTDRPVYRPGHEVHFRFILRVREPDSYQIPQLQNVNVEVQGPEDKTIYKKTLPVSALGTGGGSVIVPKDAGLGYYSVVVRAGQDTTQAGFEVQEYKKPEYEVRVNPAKARILQGESMNATIDARYFFGEPVANAKVSYVLHRSRYWYPIWGAENGEDEETNPGDGPDYDFGGEQTEEKRGTLDANGQLKITLPATFDPEHEWDDRFRIEARVTDAGNREISGHASVIATHGSFLVNIEPEAYVATPGKPAGFKLLAIDYDGKPVAAKVQVRLNSGAGKKLKLISEVSGETGADGKGRVTITIPSGGSFSVRASARTPENREVISTAYVWASGGDSFFSGGAGDRIQIIPDKRSYQPGDIAKVLIVTGVPNTKVLVSREGRGLSDLQVLSATESSVTVSFPVRPNDEPGFFASAIFIKDNALHQGSKLIKVPALDKQMNVAVSSNKPQYRPGESAQFVVEARDRQGKPVAGEFSVGIVDEAVYGVRPDSTPDMMQTFYGNSYNTVYSASSLVYFFHGEAGKRRMMLSQIGASTAALAQLKPDALVQPKVRKEFPDTALWLPAVKTGADGRGAVNVTFPDSVTTWRTTTRGITADTKVGAAVKKTIVRKNLILRLAAPRFLTQNDDVTISTIVHNYLAEEKRVQVSLEAKGVEIAEAAPRDITIPSKGESKVDWRVHAGAIGSAVFTGKALTNEESDALELTIPVEPQGVPITKSRSGIQNAAFQLAFPEQVIPVTRQIEISVSPSVAGALFSALDYLTQFPYGCTEQTLSSFVPNVVVSKAVSDLGLESGIDRVALNRKIHAGLDRLRDFQHEDGGWGWWKTDDSGIFMTTAAIAGLSQAKAAGVDVNPEMLQNGVKWLKAAYAKEPRMVADLKAYAVYALALAGDNSQTEDAWKQRSSMSPYGQALLGLALEAFKDSRSGQVAAALETAVKTNDVEAWWPNSRNTLMDFEADSSVEATASVLKLLVHETPQSALLPKASVYLMNHRSEGFYWYSTGQTAAVIYGLTDYLKATGELKPNLKVSATVNGQQVLNKTFVPADALALNDTKITVPAESANDVKIESSGEGRLYWSVKQAYYSTDRKAFKAGSASLNILRDYFKLSPVREKDAILYQLDPLQGPLAIGDVLAVRITVTGGDWKYLLMEDPIPAGAEFIERDDLYELKTKPSWWNSYFSRREFHDDRAAIFQTYFNAGQKEYFYLLKIVNPGSFRVSPARVQPMYQPDVLSTTENKSVEVKP